MRVMFASLVGLSFMVFVALVATPNAIAQSKVEKAEKARKENPGITNIQGTVQTMNREASTIMVRVNASVTRPIVYSPTTHFLYGHSDNNKPGAIAQVKENDYISCAGAVNAKQQLMATACVYRETR